ncbi:2TM domain-containing protein [Halpernia frigidisoli]|uniref:2TM domain-containing protein n=1 Tax=Halpernia frigidisoli TaxID=1125876 RepID=A0A1I3GYW0_9FLAO|nr:2TM domain-containing protein [Halpernia frigidisoli]SFI28653.1 2TM domain-containing protein [Halpernia frigidisoli]
MENLSKNEIDYSIAKERVRQMKKFYTGLAIFIIALAFYYFRADYLNKEISIFHIGKISGVFWVWGIILAIKGVKTFFLNASWERKIMDRELNQNNHGN